MQHLIWNLLSTIKNGSKARKKSIIVQNKSSCVNIVKVLYKEGYINGFRILPSHRHKIEIFLKYDHGEPVISKINPISKPGKRVYVTARMLWHLDTSLQTLVLSTPMGILSDKQSRKTHVGGELICLIQ